MTASLGARGLSKATGYRETEDGEGLRISICTAIGSPISMYVCMYGHHI